VDHIIVLGEMHLRRFESGVEHELGGICVGLDGPEAKRNDEGFAFMEPAYPTKPGKITQWRARTGDVVTSNIEFRPDRGSSMLGLVSGKRPEAAEPLKNAEFFSAVLRLPPPARERVLDALWQIANGCSSCGGSARQELYGVAIDVSTVAYSGCGWWMYGARLNCGESDALAVWLREGKGFYFATDKHRDDGNHVDDTVMIIWPALKEWPAPARDRFEKWRAGRPWPTIIEAK
jgi:hypothetical protein